MSKSISYEHIIHFIRLKIQFYQLLSLKLHEKLLTFIYLRLSQRTTVNCYKINLTNNYRVTLAKSAIIVPNKYKFDVDSI